MNTVLRSAVIGAFALGTALSTALPSFAGTPRRPIPPADSGTPERTQAAGSRFMEVPEPVLISQLSNAPGNLTMTVHDAPCRVHAHNARRTLFTIPSGSVVRVINGPEKGWVRVLTTHRSAWGDFCEIPATAI